MVRAVAVIPARYASERFPGKPLAPIDGVPMIARVLANVLESKRADRVVVATDDERIATVVVAAGGEVVMTPTDLPSGSDRVWAAIEGGSDEIVVNVQGDEPLLPGSVVDDLIARLLDDDEADIATPVVSTPRIAAAPLDLVTVACDDRRRALYFSRAVIPWGADPVWRHLGVYAYRRDALRRFVAAPRSALEEAERLEQLRALGLGLHIAAVEVQAQTHAVDRPEDVAAVERYLTGTGTAADARLRPRTGLVVLDVDGVLTDGTICYQGDEEQLMSFDVKDGLGIVALGQAGIPVALLSARDSAAVRRRARELGVAHVRLGISDKAAELERLAADLGVPLQEVCYVGDDAGDVEAMGLAGLSAAPADATPPARAQATISLTRNGGRGAVRELADLLLA